MSWATETEEEVDRLIAMCQEELHLLLENQENWWQYPLATITLHVMHKMVMLICFLTISNQTSCVLQGPKKHI